MLNFSMLLAHNNRSKAYLQSLVKKGLSPSAIILLKNEQKQRAEQTETDVQMTEKTNQAFVRTSHVAGLSFDEKESLPTTAKRNNIPVVELDSTDVNAPETVAALRQAPGDLCVYSGPGGTILRQEILGAGKKIVHVHPGFLPQYRGSTTMYYSLLLERKLAASVIFMDEKIDEGPVLHTKEFDAAKQDEELDYVTDPAMRAATLIEFFEKVRSDGKTPAGTVEHAKAANTFFIIHPVLKHLALQKYYGN